MTEYINIPSNHGGPREGAGRYYAKDPKKQTYLYIRESVIEALGGKEKIQQIMQAAVDEAYKKLNEEPG